VPEYTTVDLSGEVRQFDADTVADLLRDRNIDFPKGAEPHVILRARVTWVQDLGWLNFIGNWHVWCEPPGDHADWVSAIAPSSAGKMEVWLTQLSPDDQYLAYIDVSGSSGGPDPAFMIGASDASHMLVDLNPPDQILLVLFTPAKDMSLITVEPHHLDWWAFREVRVFRLS
jgi:hypothetical protein